ncbi:MULTISPECIES: large-conductance mechanosensitive channel protein MscL [Roseivirga]|jgi:large conductance mechanosensitive channel|uniref:Large-conductance mechanosensitive channel n=1 Tax=Roseivirga spongicola TaxID=333140 RepID=A0A150XAQ7_9BACT|nr:MULTISPECIES: large-conductance mechanosensitive channel protein MscL [Roseivirga]KYG75798.1 mechanosensitive ion channel protein MscL [Roseivirga spongicola]MBO6662753.1 large-conductance mechanosensitive channel protein MscL [Roseivirga sp.]MBO6759789.1 large-conductance mechanosensitive channel protein MscL [Roseivirga sp.]MBO6909869.1 large-conductance mechanosensitive channel protein MscL [Roseivirga sp.]WPZ10637.1 large-conductance mechanosensitive channel protein MscL [Roseivirga spo
MKEFQKFISKGNVVEIAVGLIMATYFGAIAKSLVNDVIMPPIGLLLGGVDFSTMKVVLQEASADGATAEVAINYGIFFNTVLTFVIVAFAVFMIVKSYNRMKERWEKKEEAAPAAPPKPTKEEVLLTEIRDLLKK